MKKQFFLLPIIFLTFFFFYSRSVRSGYWRDFDFAVTVKIQEKIDKSAHLRTADFIGNVMEGSTYLASPEISVIAVLVLTFLASVSIRKKRINLRGLIIPFLFVLLILGEIYGKTVVRHPSPPFYMIKNPITIFPKEYINEQYSYPSGHAARAVFIAISLNTLYVIRNTAKKSIWIKLIIYFCLALYITLVSFSRIYLGHHWTSDVIGGILLGSGLGLLTLSGIPHIIHSQ